MRVRTFLEKSKSLESWIWGAACSIREAKDPPKYKDYLLPLIFFEKGAPMNFITEDGIARIADTLIGWKDEEKLSRMLDQVERKKNDYFNLYIHTCDAETRVHQMEVTA